MSGTQVDQQIKDHAGAGYYDETIKIKILKSMGKFDTVWNMAKRKHKQKTSKTKQLLFYQIVN